MAAGVAETRPQNAARWDHSEPRLVERIRDEILAAPRERITFARFMERALTEPAIGYYASSELRPTRTGDFLTAPELHPFFGRCVGRFLASVWQHAGEAKAFSLHEYGAGRGTLRATTIDGLRADRSPLAEAIAWQRIDLPQRTDAGTDDQADIVVANEYLDALPVHRVIHEDGVLLEAWVGWRDGWFAEIPAEPSTPKLAAHLEADGVVLQDRQRAEICLAAPAWMGKVAASLAEGGLVLVIDYGHHAAELYGPRRLAGSLLTYREHEVSDDPFAAVGRTDITAHVDISAVERAADDAGLELHAATDQARFLADLGLGGLLAELGRRPDTEAQAYLDARGAVARLLDPRHLGGFRVLVWGRPQDQPAPTLRGFTNAA